MLSVFDLEGLGMLNPEYDVALFASGFEQRSIHVPKTLLDSRRFNIHESHVLGFAEMENADQRKTNDSWYKSSLGIETTISRASDGDRILKILNAVLKKRRRNGRLSILVDYSVISKPWLATIVRWAMFFGETIEISIDFMYSIGLYDLQLPNQEMVVEDIKPLAGFEGAGFGADPLLLMLGLGFDGFATQVVIEQFEPKQVVMFMAEPGANEEAESECRRINANLLEGSSYLALPLESVDSAARTLIDVLKEARSRNLIASIVPMGPKPLTLASLIAASVVPEASVFRVSGSGAKGVGVQARGDIIKTRVLVGPSADSEMKPRSEEELGKEHFWVEKGTRALSQ